CRRRQRRGHADPGPGARGAAFGTGASGSAAAGGQGGARSLGRHLRGGRGCVRTRARAIGPPGRTTPEPRADRRRGRFLPGRACGRCPRGGHGRRTEGATPMNPLDWRGPEFLAFYVVLFLAAVAVAFFLRRFLRLPGDEPSQEALELSPYEVAYLAGGEELAVNAAMARLVHEEVLAVDAVKRRLTRQSDQAPRDAGKLE